MDSTPPSFVSASTTQGYLTRYSSSEALNSTLIGTYCTSQGPGGVCNGFTTIDQPGWFWDGKMVFVHYVGGPSTVITVG